MNRYSRLVFLVVEAVWAGSRRNLSPATQNPRRHAPRVPQQRRVGRPMDVRFHRRGVGADRGSVDDPRLHRRLSQGRVDRFPRGRTDGLEASVEEAVVHHGPLPRPQEILEELALRDPHLGLPQREALDRVDHQRPQDGFRREIRIPPVAAARREPRQVLMCQFQDLGVLVQDPADALVLLPILAYRFGQVIVVPGKRQHGFSYPTHPCPPLAWLNDVAIRIRMRLLLAIAVSPPTAGNPFRNRNSLLPEHRTLGLHQRSRRSTTSWGTQDRRRRTMPYYEFRVSVPWNAPCGAW